MTKQNQVPEDLQFLTFLKADMYCLVCAFKKNATLYTNEMAEAAMPFVKYVRLYKTSNTKKKAMQSSTIQTAKAKAIALNNMSSQKIYPAIQLCTYIGYKTGSLFSEENLLLFVKEGTFTFRYGEIKYALSKGQVAMIKKGILIEYQAGTSQSSNENTAFITAFITYDLIREFTKLANLNITISDKPSPVHIEFLSKRLQQYLDSLEPYLEDGKQQDTGILLRIKFLELLFCLSYTNSGILEQLLDVHTQFRSNITAMVEENIMNSLSLDQLAVLAGRSLSSFRRDFLAIYNMPPSQWIRQKRLEKAQELLLHTKMTITDICYTLGFENIAHFSRLFKSHLGFAPSSFRVNTPIA